MTFDEAAPSTDAVSMNKSVIWFARLWSIHSELSVTLSAFVGEDHGFNRGHVHNLWSRQSLSLRACHRLIRFHTDIKAVHDGMCPERSSESHLVTMRVIGSPTDVCKAHTGGKAVE